MLWLVAVYGTRDSTIKNNQGAIKRLRTYPKNPTNFSGNVLNVLFKRDRPVLLKKTRKILARVSYILTHHHAIYNLYYCAQSHFLWSLFLLSGIGFIFLMYCIQNLLESSSLKINPKLSHVQTPWKMVITKWFSWQLMSEELQAFQIFHFRIYRNLSSLSSHSSGHHCSKSRRQLSKRQLQPEWLCANLSWMDWHENLVIQ